MIAVRYLGEPNNFDDAPQAITLSDGETLWNRRMFENQLASGHYLKPLEFFYKNRLSILRGKFEAMFFFKYTGKNIFVRIDNQKFYKLPWKKEQLETGEYNRPLEFFFQNRVQMLREQIEITGIKPSMDVCFDGTVPIVIINRKMFKKGTWETIPIDFDSTDKNGNDQLLSHKFKFRIDGATASNLQEYKDGDILIIRKLGGLGDILMQSQIFPELRARYPKTKIYFAIPKEYRSIFDGCFDITGILDKAEVEQKIFRLVATTQYGLISDITQSCIIGEHAELKDRGYISKSRQEIWAESFGLFGGTFKKTSIVVTDEEVSAAREKYFSGVKKKIICIVPVSAEKTRSYPLEYTTKVIEDLKNDYHIVVMHHEKLNLACQQICVSDFREMGAIIKNLCCMISVDTGPLHFAGILGVPLVGIFGVTDGYPRMKHYKGIHIQGECEKDNLPCWYSMTGCSRIKSGGYNIAKCMDISPEIIIENTRKVI